MDKIERLRSLGLFDARVPRYTSYPTAPVFSADAGGGIQASELARLDPGEPVSLYVHIPFCERLCWFCACRTQGTQTLSPVESYMDTLEAELAMLKRHLPDGLRMKRLHWGGGTPTILPPEMIHRLAQAIKTAVPPVDGWEFSVEIDPTMVDRAKIAALAAEGMNRASIGIQDFDPLVQSSIGRIQPFDVTLACVEDLRAAGIASLNADLVYGLPHQNMARLRDTVDKVRVLDPDRLALFGYAHVPWMSKRQKLIDEKALPCETQRFELAEMAGRAFVDYGFHPIGIDHFARPGDELCEAARTGRLRRNFQGYTADDCPTLIGIGASSISRLPGGYVQNAAATGAYAQRIAAGRLAGTRGHAFSPEDHLRGRAIEMLMCNFELDLAALRAEFGAEAETLASIHAEVAQRYGEMVEQGPDKLRIRPEGRALTRIVASAYDAYASAGRFSKAS